MKMKKRLFVIGALVVVAALAGMLYFVFSGDELADNTASAVPNMSGTWKVAANVQSGNTVLPEKEFFVFTDTSADGFRDDTEKAYASSSYTLKPTAEYGRYELAFSDIGRKYSMAVVTDNYVRLYETSAAYMELIRYANSDMSDNEYSRDMIEDHWVVAYRNTSEQIAEEKLHFVDGILHDYRNGSPDPVASVPYYWNDAGHICVDALGAEMICCPLSDDVIMLIEVGTGYIWELHKDAQV